MSRLQFHISSCCHLPSFSSVHVHSIFYTHNRTHTHMLCLHASQHNSFWEKKKKKLLFCCHRKTSLSSKSKKKKNRLAYIPSKLAYQLSSLVTFPFLTAFNVKNTNHLVTTNPEYSYVNDAHVINLATFFVRMIFIAKYCICDVITCKAL